MAKKSKAQRAKASARRAAKREAAEQGVVAPVEEETSSGGILERVKEKVPIGSSEKEPEVVNYRKEAKAKPISRRFGFLSDVRAEMHRVTWPTRTDVFNWSVVVVVALLFFTLFTVVLDDWIVTPILFAISSLGA